MNRNNLNFTSEREGKKENINNIRVKIYKPPGEKKRKTQHDFSEREWKVGKISSVNTEPELCAGPEIRF